MSNTSSSAISSAQSIKSLPRRTSFTADSAPTRPTFARPSIESGKDRMFGNLENQPTFGPHGRDPAARARLDSGCQQLFTLMHEGMHWLSFKHEGKEAMVIYSEHGDPALIINLGSRSNALEISSMANISYRGKPFAQLTPSQLEAANSLVSTALAAKLRQRPFPLPSL